MMFAVNVVFNIYSATIKKQHDIQRDGYFQEYFNRGLGKDIEFHTFLI